MSVFVTVGTTSFDRLIQTVCSEKCINLLTASGYKKLILQIGAGSYIPSENSCISIQWFRYKDSIKDDFQEASLIIGHAGAGTVLESLSMKKPLIVVLNEELMDNHQEELALKLASEGYLMDTHCSSLVDSLRSYLSGEISLQHYEPAREDFSVILHQILGLK